MKKSVGNREVFYTLGDKTLTKCSPVTIYRPGERQMFTMSDYGIRHSYLKINTFFVFDMMGKSFNTQQLELMD